MQIAPDFTTPPSSSSR